MARSLNRVQLIGNLTRDPELRYTPQGTAVCSFSIATNRSWTTDSGEKKDEADFHRIVAWNKLAELCSQFLTKGRKVYVEGRLSTRNWQAQDGAQRSTTEVIISDMILLDSSGNRATREEAEGFTEEEQDEDTESGDQEEETSSKKKTSKEKSTHTASSGQAKRGRPKKDEKEDSDDVDVDDIPF